jgi:hypothetical protein
MKKILILALLALPLVVLSQTKEKQYFIYNIVTLSGSIDNEGLKVDLDNGKEIKKLRDNNGKKITFNTPAAALMYFISEGWELYVNGATSQGGSYNGTGGTSTTIYWIIRKPCTKEEFDRTVKECIIDKKEQNILL